MRSILDTCVLLFLMMGHLPSVNDGISQRVVDTRTALSSPQKDAEPYKLVFVKEYEGKRVSVGEEEYDKHRRSSLRNFNDCLNEAGKLGYRLVTASRGLTAILKSDETQFDYNWFETISPVHFVTSGLTQRLAENRNDGFRVIEHFPLSQSCEPLFQEDPAFGDKCIYKDLFLTERQSSSKEALQQVIVSSQPGWGVQPSVEIVSEIDEKLAEGFYPVLAISKFEVLLEQAKKPDDIIDEKPDVQVVRAEWGDGNLQQKVNNLAKQGFRLAMANYGIAVMYRNNDTRAIPVTYIWLRADKKGFEKELTKLQQKGVHYRTVYPNEKGISDTLIFEQRLDGKGERGEFRILNFEFNVTENLAEGKVYRDLSPSSKDAVKLMNELARQGFVVRDFFDSGKVSLLLERMK